MFLGHFGAQRKHVFGVIPSVIFIDTAEPLVSARVPAGSTPPTPGIRCDMSFAVCHYDVLEQIKNINKSDSYVTLLPSRFVGCALDDVGFQQVSAI